MFGSIGKKDFESLPLLHSSALIVQSFDKIIAPLDERIQINEEKIRTLVALRDTILPRLISGQLQLPIENLMREAVK